MHDVQSCITQRLYTMSCFVFNEDSNRRGKEEEVSKGMIGCEGSSAKYADPVLSELGLVAMLAAGAPNP